VAGGSDVTVVCANAGWQAKGGIAIEGTMTNASIAVIRSAVRCRDVMARVDHGQPGCRLMAVVPSWLEHVGAMAVLLGERLWRLETQLLVSLPVMMSMCLLFSDSFGPVP
jgi:hypothetical protein